MVTDLMWAVEKLIALIPSFDKAASSRRDLEDNALRAISHALKETFLYYRDIDAGRPRNPEIEGQLCHYWAAAAIPLRHIDRKLAEKCELKSEYWVNPEHWSQEKIEQLGIGLENVQDQYHSLLFPKKQSRTLRHRANTKS